MVAKKKIRTDYSKEDFTHLINSKTLEELQKLASSFVNVARRGHRAALHSLLALLLTGKEMGTVVMDDAHMDNLMGYIRTEFNYMRTLKQCLDLFEFSVGMLDVNGSFHTLVTEMIPAIPECLTNLKKTRKVLALFPNLVKHKIPFPRKIFTFVMSEVNARKDEWTVDDLSHITLLLTEISQKSEVAGAFQLHDVLRQEINHKLIAVYLKISESNKGDKNMKLRGIIYAYLRAVLLAMPECSRPDTDEGRPMVEKWRKLLLQTAVKQYTIGFYKRNGLCGAEIRHEGLNLIAHFVFPSPSHHAFIDRRIHSCIVQGMNDSDFENKKLAVSMASSLIYSAWFNIYSEDDDSFVDEEKEEDENPLRWLRYELPDLLLDLAESGFLMGIASAVVWADPTYREHLLEILHLFVCEDKDGTLLDELEDADVMAYITQIDQKKLTTKEKTFVSIIYEAMPMCQEAPGCDGDLTVIEEFTEIEGIRLQAN